MIRGKNDRGGGPQSRCPKNCYLCPRGVRYKNRDEVRLWVPKRDVIQKLDRLTALRNRLIKVRKMMQSPLTDCKDFISKKDLNEAKKSCENTLKSLDKDIKKVNQDIQSTIQNDGSGRPSIFKRTARAAPSTNLSNQ